MINVEIDIKAELAILESRLEWPDKATLNAYYHKLLSNPGSVVLLALEAPREPAGPQWKSAWFSSKERDTLRKAIIKVNAARAKRQEQPTSELPES